MRANRIVVVTLVLVFTLALTAGCKNKKKDTPPQPKPPADTMDTEQVAPAKPERPETYLDDVAQVTVTRMEPIYFAYDSSELSSAARQTLADNAAWMRAHPDRHVLIEGHCDERGTEEYNQALGERRARAARDYLIALGVSPQQLSTISYGEERPADPGHDEAAWAKNRRAEFKTLGS